METSDIMVSFGKSKCIGFAAALVAATLSFAQEVDEFSEDPVEIQPVTTNGISYGNNPLVLPKITPVPTIQDVSSLSPTTPIKEIDIAEVKRIMETKGIDPMLLNDILALSKSKGIDALVIVDIFAQLNSNAITESTLVDIASVVETKKLSEAQLQDVLALVALKSNKLASRFDTLKPATFSNLWILKMKGKELESKGENTDEIWKKYWDVFQKAAQQGTN